MGKSPPADSTPAAPLGPQAWNAEDEGWEPIPTPGSDDTKPPPEPDIEQVRKRDMPGNPIGPDDPDQATDNKPAPAGKAARRRL